MVMQLFQYFSLVLIFVFIGGGLYSVIKNRYFVTESDKYGRRHKRDVRNGRFVKMSSK